MNALDRMMPLATPEPSASAPTNAKEAAKQFEAVFVKQLLAQMPLPGIEGSETQAFLGMFQDALANQLVEGGGLGLADQLEAAMERRAPSAPGQGQAGPRAYGVTSGFGMRTDPFDGVRRKHQGVDLAAPAGAPIRAAREGVVRFAGTSGGYGNLVVVDHGNGLETRYGHCDALSVKPGDVVGAGQAMATVGSTGRSTGPHLHFEVRRGGVAEDPGAMAGDVLR